jgi:hypothetical protein
MDSLAYVTYFDNIERGGYRPDLVVENWNSCNSRIICTSPIAGDVVEAMDLDVKVVDIGMQIHAPSDIAVALNKTVDVGFELGFDWVVLIFGDLYLTVEGDEFIAGCIRQGKGPGGMIPVLGTSLYSSMYIHNNQININSVDYRPCRVEVADGEEMEIYPEAWTDNPLLALDLGYLGTKQYYRKMKNHVNIWPDQYKREWIRMYESGNIDGAIEMAYGSMRFWRGAPLSLFPYDAYKLMIDRLNLHDDFERCKSIMSKFM